MTSIGGYAFSDCSSLDTLTFNAISCADFNLPAVFSSSISSLTFGNNVTTIPAYFLYNGSKVKSVTIPEAVTSISSGAFSGCSALTAITIPEAVTSIGSGTFRDCSSLTAITIPEAVTSIGSNAFSGCSALDTLTFNAISCANFSSSVVFSSSISSLTFGNNVTTIPAYFLCNGSKVESVTLPDSLKAIGSRAFYNNSKLKGIVIPASVSSIGNYAFYGCSSLYKSAYPSGLNDPFSYGVRIAYPKECSIDENNVIYDAEKTKLFYAPVTLEGAYIIPNSVTSIESNAFYGCSAMSSITIPDAVTFIGNYAFGNSSIKSVTFGSGLITIDGSSGSDNAFSGTSIAKAFWLGNTPPSGCNYVNAKVNYVANDQYNLSNQMKYQFLSSRFTVDGVVYIPVSPAERTCDIVDCIYDKAFSSVDISDKVTNMGIEMSVVNVNQYAFYGNNYIQDLTISNNGAIGDYAFYGCSSLPEVVIPNSVTSLGASAFENCSALEDVQIGTGIPMLQTRVFSGCSSLSSISIPDNIGSIEDHVFQSCSNLKKVVMADGTSELQLGSNGSSPLFADCPLDSVYIGRNILYNTSSGYGYSPFYRNASLRTVTITDEETEIGDNEFYGCTNLKNVTIGNGVTTIGDWAFSGCSSLDYFAFGSAVDSIGREAFSDCTAMTKIVSHAITPPTCGSQALDDINKWTCVLSVPEGNTAAYQQADQWKEFFFINDDVSGVDVPSAKDQPRVKDCYDLNGKQISQPQRGLNIIRMSDGTTKKVVVK